MPTIDYKEIEKRKTETPQQSAARLHDELKAWRDQLNAQNNRVYKSPLEQSEALNQLPQGTQKIKNWDEDKYNEIVDFISTYRGDGVPLGDIQNQLLEDYGPEYTDLVRHALSKWAE